MTSADSNRPLLSVSGLVAGYRGSEVLHGVSIDVAAGEAVAILGPNGAGKSTLLNVVSGLVPARLGSIEMAGRSLTNRSAHEIVAAGLVQVPEGRQVFPEMTVEENLLLGAFTRQRGSEQRLQEVLETFPRLRERLHQDAQTLSGGEQQMLAIGRGLMAEPALLMLDEPTLGLAPILVDDVLERLCTIREHFGTTLLVVEQNAYLTRELCDRFYVLSSGVVARQGDRMPEDTEELMLAYLGES
jgi:branched-chain amino acid transport system ATP-binding protein